MTDEHDTERRLSRLEVQQSRMEVKYDDLERRVTAMPSAADYALVAERVKTLAEQFTTFVTNMTNRETEDKRERQAWRRAMWGLTAVIVAALIAAAVEILKSGSHP